ncbi:hypothetical protein [Algiphilus sp.]|uniref:hypothetical protein n=1 Tax=Algiphilus sp. TaxID=1872431 RepID=UPI003BAC849D
MKAILREYLASLRERDELDAILPDLLSEMGLTVFSRPGRGTRQDGVDVAAVGNLPDTEQCVYLFAIKPGDLTRTGWDGDSVQSVRPTLNEILDSYLPNRMPAEHADKPVVVCICCGGDIQEQVRQQIEGFKRKNTRPGLSFEEWNGDRLAELLKQHLLNEELLPDASRAHLRKTLALLEEPEAAYAHFAKLLDALGNGDTGDPRGALKGLRQMTLCSWILLAWARDVGNVEAAYQGLELALLKGWCLTKQSANASTKNAEAISMTYGALINAYLEVAKLYLERCVMPFVGDLHALSLAIRGPSSIDVGLKLFEVLGRLAMTGLWAEWGAANAVQDEEKQQAHLDERDSVAKAIVAIIAKNPALNLPVKDDHAIEITLALLVLAPIEGAGGAIEDWLAEIIERCRFAYDSHGAYPCSVQRYSDLLDRDRSEAYRSRVTSGSILYPTVSLWSALLGLDGVYAKVADFKKSSLSHCTLQLWLPDEKSEELLWHQRMEHGVGIARLPVEREKQELVDLVFEEASRSSHLKQLSAMQHGMWPLILVACRHHRVPVPVEFLERFRKTEADRANTPESNSQKNATKEA